MQMMVISYFYTEYRDDDAFSISILNIQMMMFNQYSHTKDANDDTYDACDDAFSIHILEIQMMIVQHSHIEDANDDGSDDDVTR